MGVSLRVLFLRVFFSVWLPGVLRFIGLSVGSFRDSHCASGYSVCARMRVRVRVSVRVQ